MTRRKIDPEERRLKRAILESSLTADPKQQEAAYGVLADYYMDQGRALDSYLTLETIKKVRLYYGLCTKDTWPLVDPTDSLRKVYNLFRKRYPYEPDRTYQGEQGVLGMVEGPVNAGMLVEIRLQVFVLRTSPGLVKAGPCWQNLETILTLPADQDLLRAAPGKLTTRQVSPITTEHLTIEIQSPTPTTPGFGVPGWDWWNHRPGIVPDILEDQPPDSTSTTVRNDSSQTVSLGTDPSDQPASS